jgi:hypothetical protein
MQFDARARKWLEQFFLFIVNCVFSTVRSIKLLLWDVSCESNSNLLDFALNGVIFVDSISPRLVFRDDSRGGDFKCSYLVDPASGDMLR